MVAWMLFAACREVEVASVESPPVVAHAFQSLDAPAGAITYRLDPKASWLYVVVRNDRSRMMSGYGHDHGIRAMDLDGTVRWDASQVASCAIEISFPVTALQPDPPGMRERAKLDPKEAVDDEAKASIRENFLGKSQLDAESYPTITYRSTSCAGGPESVQVAGTLTIHGVTKPVTTTMTVKASPTSFAAAGSFKARATDFGFKPYSNLGGTLRNLDEMTFVIDVVGAPR